MNFLCFIGSLYNILFSSIVHAHYVIKPGTKNKSRKKKYNFQNVEIFEIIIEMISVCEITQLS